jgi:hypothetical protein
MLCVDDGLMTIAFNERNRSISLRSIVSTEFGNLLYDRILQVYQPSAYRLLRATTRFQHPFKPLTPFFQAAFNSNGGGTVTRLRDRRGEKKHLPALFCPVTLPNKAASQRYLSRDHR